MVASENKKIFFLAVSFFFLLAFISLTKWTGLFFAGSLLPVVFFAILILSFTDINPVFYALVFLLPLSVKTTLPGTDTQVIVPGELVESLLFFVYLMRYFTGKQKFDSAFFFHPVTISLFLFIFFSFAGLFFSTMPVVSLKALAVKTIYIGVYYFFFHEIIRGKNWGNVTPFLYYGFAASLIVIYSIYNHAQFHFSKNTSGIVSLPFYADHTIYSACLSFVLPVFLMKLFNKEQTSKGLYVTLAYLLISTVLLTGIFFSYCRASWISLVTGLVVFSLIRFKIKTIFIITGLILLGVYVFVYQETIISSFKQNRYDSNARGAGLEEQTRSITNISNDQSNGERLNRWKCALRMFEERPWFGFGPGTYQFQYLSFQRKKDMTRISVLNPYHIEVGHGGSAHSEYLLLLSESGIFAFLSFVAVIFITIVKGFKNSMYGTGKHSKNMATAMLIGLITYLTHGFFNNFLDTDKAAFLFWGALSLLTTLDIQFKPINQQPE